MYREREHQLECLLAAAVGIVHARALSAGGEMTNHEQQWLEDVKRISPGVREASDLIVAVQGETP